MPATLKPRVFLASLLLFVGLSAGNAAGGVLQAALLAVGLLIALTAPSNRLPAKEIALAFACGVIALVASFQKEPVIAVLIKYVRPMLEGYVLAVVLYRICQVHTLAAACAALTGYVALQVVAALLMATSPELRLQWLNNWYGDESYDQFGAFGVALAFRGFGVSRHHLFGLSLAMGLIAAILLIFNALHQKHSRRLLFGIAAASAAMLALVNARIGAIPVLACLACGALWFMPAYFVKRILAFALVVVPAATVVLLHLFGDELEPLINWLADGAVQFLDTDPGGGGSTFTDLGTMVHLPATLSAWAVGEGAACNSGESCYSDIGYVRLLQDGGLLLVAMVMALHATVTSAISRWVAASGTGSSVRLMGSVHIFVYTVLATTFIAATIKGEAYAANEYSRLVMMLAALAAMSNSQRPDPLKAVAVAPLLRL